MSILYQIILSKSKCYFAAIPKRMIQQTVFPFKIEITREKLTARGGLALITITSCGLCRRVLRNQITARNSSFQRHRITATSQHVDVYRRKPVPAVFADHKVPFLSITLFRLVADIAGIEDCPYNTVRTFQDKEPDVLASQHFLDMV
jgi:hypothetical protein